MRDFQRPGRSAVFATEGMCATSHPLAAAVALDTLKAGGNAVDAAIAAAVLLGYCEPHMTGLGGDCFALIRPAGSGEVVALNGSGRAPAALRAADLRAAGGAAVPVHDAAAVTVPGAVDAFCRLADRFGRLGLDRVLAPAIHYAEAGVPVGPRTAWDWARVGHLRGAARDRFLPGGAAPAPGTLFRAPGEAEVLRRIAREGRAGFYAGEVAADMVASLRALGGLHREADFAATEATWGEPVGLDHAGLRVLEHPPNGQGATALLMLAILARFDLAALDPFGAERAHLEAEAAKLAYDARDRFLADGAATTRLAHMLAPETAARLAALIDPDRALPEPRAAAEAVHRDTVCLCVVDRDRMAVSLLCSLFHAFGAGLASDRFGICFQNRGAGFTLAEGHPNEAAGGKRPLHTILPGMILRDGVPEMPFGVMGGAYQPAGHARFVTNLTAYGLHPQAAIDAPRSFPTPAGLALERGYDAGVAAALAAKGHLVVPTEEPLGGAQAIRIHASGVLEGASDPRKDGCALGY